jgi:hypothetical protein
MATNYRVNCKGCGLSYTQTIPDDRYMGIPCCGACGSIYITVEELPVVHDHPPRIISDTEAVEMIRGILSGRTWEVEDLDDIAGVIRNTGRTVEES